MLKDLYPTSSGGDLAVTIQEERRQQNAIHASLCQRAGTTVRNGQVKYALGAGKYRPTGNQDAPSFAQGELFYGWRYGLTFLRRGAVCRSL